MIIIPSGGQGGGDRGRVFKKGVSNKNKINLKKHRSYREVAFAESKI